MPILTLNLKLPSEFVTTATAGTSSDWLIIQKSGETEVSKIAAVPAAVGAAPAGGELATNWQCNYLRSASGYLYAQADGGSLLSSISMYDTGVADRMVFRNEAGFQFYGSLTGTTLGPIYAGNIYQNGTQILAATGWGGTPSALGSASAGTATTVARSDHVHPTTPASARGASLGSASLPWSLCYVSSTTGNLGILHGAACYTTATDGWKIRQCDTSGTLSTTLLDLTCDSVIESSDARGKVDTAGTDLGLDFLLSLRPVKYKWGPLDKSLYALPGDDQDGSPQPQPSRPPPGVRWHYGFLAQEVKAALGERDFAGYIYDAPTDSYGLRYSQFIAPLVRAVQELSEQVAMLSSKLKDAEAKLTVTSTVKRA